ncbi:MAG: hypothetical protein WCF24_01135 [Acidimicrobiales bacterium]
MIDGAVAVDIRLRRLGIAQGSRRFVVRSMNSVLSVGMEVANVTRQRQSGVRYRVDARGNRETQVGPVGERLLAEGPRRSGVVPIGGAWPGGARSDSWRDHRKHNGERGPRRGATVAIAIVPRSPNVRARVIESLVRTTALGHVPKNAKLAELPPVAEVALREESEHQPTYVARSRRRNLGAYARKSSVESPKRPQPTSAIGIRTRYAFSVPSQQTQRTSPRFGSCVASPSTGSVVGTRRCVSCERSRN